MFDPVNRRFVRTLIYALVAGQALLFAPVNAGAGEHRSGHAAAEMPCADSMPQTDDSKPCPCCPDGTSGMAACLSACTGAVAALPAVSVGIAPLIALPMRELAFARLAGLSDPPLKPPPIA
jgi:hypothetical protein